MKQSNIIRNKKEYIVRNLKNKYDNKNDLFYVYKQDSNVYSNIVIGNFHLEIDKAGKIIGVEILNASDILKEYNIAKNFLNNTDKIELKVVNKGNLMIIFLVFNTKNQTKTATITMNSLDSQIAKVMAVA